MTSPARSDRPGVPAHECAQSAIVRLGVTPIVLGARGVGCIERPLLGSVAEDAPDHASVSVLIAR